MCGRFELKTKFEMLPKVLKQDYPSGLDSRYETQNLIRPNDPVLVIKNEGRIKTTFMAWGFIPPWVKDPFDKKRSRPFNARSETIEEKKLFSGSWKHKRCYFDFKYQRVTSVLNDLPLESILNHQLHYYLQLEMQQKT